MVMGDPNRLSFVMVTYYSEVHFPHVIANIRSNTPVEHEIIVVDNGSKRPREILGDKVLHNPSNVYFTKAVNQGIEMADSRSDCVILMNPDVRLTRSTISDILDDMQALKAGVAGAILVYHDFVVQHAGGKPYEGKDDAAMLAMEKHEHLYAGERYADVRAGFPARVRWVTGALMAIRRDTIAEIGVLDERHVHYRSDSEYCVRANRHGIPVICSSGVALHFKIASSKRRNRVHEEYTRLRYKYYEKKFFAAAKKCLTAQAG
jgi:N-acetylglucosaminyl-diphospho-decaprenol L-rhamnosyltransferase